MRSRFNGVYFCIFTRSSQDKDVALDVDVVDVDVDGAGAGAGSAETGASGELSSS